MLKMSSCGRRTPEGKESRRLPDNASGCGGGNRGDWRRRELAGTGVFRELLG